MPRILLGILIVAGIAATGAAWVMNSGRGARAFPASAVVARLENADISESSGLAASRRHSGVFWTHNDRGNESLIFAINRQGKLLGRYRVDADSNDWESIAADSDGNLYIGNIGNNDSKRKSAQVYRIREPDPRALAETAQPLPVEHTYKLRFPDDQPFDAESLFVFKDFGYVISKVTRRDVPRLYRFPLIDDKRPITLEPVAELPLESPATDADLSPDGAQLAVVAMKGLYIFQVDGDPARVSKPASKYLPFQGPHDIEGITFVEDGLLATSESREIYFFPLSAPRSPQ